MSRKSCLAPIAPTAPHVETHERVSVSARGISPPSPSCCIASVTDRYLILLPSFSSSSALCLSVFFYVQLAVMQAHGVHCQFSRPDCLQPTLGLILSFQHPFPHTAAPNVSFLKKKKTVLPPSVSIAFNNKFHILTRRCRECNRDLLSCFTSVRLLTFASSRSLPYHEYRSTVFLLFTCRLPSVS